MNDITPEQITALLASLPTLSPQEQEALLNDLETLEKQRSLQRCRDGFLEFCKRVYPGFKEGPHHRFLKPILHRVSTGEERRVTVSMPPRFGKSETIAYLFVAWYLGHHPQHHIIMTTHTAELSATFGRKIRDLIDSPVYTEVFPDTVVSKDKAAAANWLTTQGGKYLAIGIGANVAGHGAHLLIADDLVSENAMLANPKAAFETAFEYMQIGPMQRLMPGGRIVLIGTRWGELDPIGKVLQWAQDNPSSDQWTEIRFPAILPSGKSLWPEQWPVEQLEAKRASLMPQQWAAQYQQEPTAEEGALIKREWWKLWAKEEPPEVEYILQAWDTAHESKTRADYSACVTMGVWFTEDRESRVIVLNCVRGQWEFPELKIKVMEQWREWQPDTLIVEKKAAGAPLIQELNRMSIMVTSVSPSRKSLGVSNDKYARMNALSDLFSAGIVYIPDKRWAWELVDEVAAFPFGAHDDRCFVGDTQITMADGSHRHICDIRRGDMVQTPLGPKEVYAAGLTGRSKTVLLQVGGRILEGTGGHPIATTKGWVRMDTVAIADTIKMSQTTGETAWRFLKKMARSWSQLFSTAESTTATPMQKKQTIESISCAAGASTCCTGTSGSTRMAQFLQECTCTIKTLIQVTIPWAIWRSSRENSTWPNTWKRPEQEGAPQRIWRNSPVSAPSPKSGTEVRRGSSGTKTSQESSSKKGAPRNSLWKKQGQSVEKTPLKRFAQSAARRFSRWLLGVLYAAKRAPVERIEPGNGRKQVFNLSVEDAHSYYANGILVHNCDCVQMCLARYRSGGFIRLPSDYQDEDADDFKARQRAYYG